MIPSFPTLVPAAEGAFSQILGIPSITKLSTAQTGGAYLLVEQTIPVGLGTPPHIHTREDEIFIILEGEVEFLAGDKTVVGRAGDIVHAPRNVAHSYTAVGAQPAKMQFIAIPGDIESMFTELATWPSDQPPDMPKLIALCASYGISFI